MREQMFLVQLVQQGVVTPQQAIDALAAQVAAHRKLGQLALERRMLSAGDVMLIQRGILDRSDLVRWAMRNAYEPSKALSAQAD
jgi:metal-responsive CopG/Arc/MetJ family transcriptional regulator